jgi:SSS family solute:Na+ symporter
MIAAFVVSISLQWVTFSGNSSVVFAKSTMITVVVTTVVWLTTTLLTQSETDELLTKFYRRVQPTIHGWKRIAALAPEITPVRDFAANTFDWVMGCALVYCAMFGIGEFVLQAWLSGLILLACATIAGWLIYWSLSKRGWQTLSGSVETPVTPSQVGLQQTD